MSLKEVLLIAGAAALFGTAFGYFLRWIISLGKKGSVELEIKQLLLDAREEAKKITEEAVKKSESEMHRVHSEIKERDDKVKKTEERLIKKEEFLDKRQQDIDKEAEELKNKVAEVKRIKEKADKLEADKRAELEKVARLTTAEAKEELIAAAEKQHEEDIIVRLKKLETVGQDKLEKRAQEILVTAIQRLGNSVASDVLSTVISIPSDDIKGKIIGKEGRNIKAFERATGVEVIVDDTPGSIVLSSFDAVRRQVARVALENLILDGRIQPAKIEKAVEKAQEEINKIIKEKGTQAAFECGVYNLDPRVLAILGRRGTPRQCRDGKGRSIAP